MTPDADVLTAPLCKALPQPLRQSPPARLPPQLPTCCRLVAAAAKKRATKRRTISCTCQGRATRSRSKSAPGAQAEERAAYAATACFLASEPACTHAHAARARRGAPASSLLLPPRGSVAHAAADLCCPTRPIPLLAAPPCCCCCCSPPRRHRAAGPCGAQPAARSPSRKPFLNLRDRVFM